MHLFYFLARDSMKSILYVCSTRLIVKAPRQNALLHIVWYSDEDKHDGNWDELRFCAIVIGS